jgi:hypothetical protein
MYGGFVSVFSEWGMTLALAMEPNIMVNSISMSWQRVCLPLKSYILDIDDQEVA